MGKPRPYKTGLENLNWGDFDTFFVPHVRLVQELAKKYQLASPMVQFFLVRPRFTSDNAAIISIGYAENIIRKWRRGEWSYKGIPIDFPYAYNEYMERMPEVAAQMMHHLLFKATQRTSQMLDATKIVRVGKAEKEVTDWQAVGKAVELILRHEGRFDSTNKEDDVYQELMAYLEERKNIPTGEELTKKDDRLEHPELLAIPDGIYSNAVEPANTSELNQKE